ncbi:MAG: hypothetical protein K0S38_216 [Candidatus Paceibacter sp.]|jgi:magnesium-transporting ATPase (P-type)|nr:hypothetical protein [Candidatus Paceibacter sp.]
MALLVAKVIIGLSFVILNFFYFRTIWYGIKVGRNKNPLSDHKTSADRMLVAALVAAVLTESMIQIFGRSMMSPLKSFHLWCVVAFVGTLLVLRFGLTGLRAPKIHRWLGYSSGVFDCLMTVTGFILLYQFKSAA